MHAQTIEVAFTPVFVFYIDQLVVAGSSGPMINISAIVIGVDPC